MLSQGLKALSVQRVPFGGCPTAANQLSSKHTHRRRCLKAQCFAKKSVVLTREQGKNDKMMKALSSRGFDCIELPLIEHAKGPDRPKLPEFLKKQYDWVTVTSPEAASVFLEAWQEAGRPKVRIAVVGGGTGEVLQQAGVEVDFVASKAIGKVMGGEMPHVPGGNNKVLYPASAKASDDLQGSLEASGFEVTRLNTYNTMGVKTVPAPVLEKAAAADVITFGSPSAVKAWVALIGQEKAQHMLYACIGSTSARACEAAGLKHIFYPEAPGIDGWVDAVLQACTKQESLLQAAS